MSFGATDGDGQYVDSDGNHVNVRFNPDGVNVNNLNDKPNDDIGLASAWKSPLTPTTGMPR